MEILHKALVLDSITQLAEAGRGRVVVAGSHCGVYPAYLAARGGVRAVILNDAGGGRDGAGIAGLDYLAALGIAAAAIGCETARIGDGRDCAARGVISGVNDVAVRCGCRSGQPAAEAAALLHGAPLRNTAPAAAETRHRLDGPWNDALEVWTLDSVSLARPEDAGAILVTGSHGALLGGDPASALKVNALAALFSDATGGIDGAGYTRLPALDARGIAAATVDARRARIGDGRSTYADGILTRVNRTAAAYGAHAAMSARAFVETIAKKKLRSTA